MFGEHMAHAFARAFAPQCDQGALAGRLQRADMLDRGFEHIGARRCAFGREIAPGMGADGDDVTTFTSPRWGEVGLRSNPGEGVRIVPNFFRWSPLTPTLSPKGRGSRWRGEWRQLCQRRNVQAQIGRAS